MELKIDCDYTTSIALAANIIMFGAKSIGKVLL